MGNSPLPMRVQGIARGCVVNPKRLPIHAHVIGRRRQGRTTDMNVEMECSTHLCIVASPHLGSSPPTSPRAQAAPSRRTMHASTIDGHSIRVGQLQEDDVATFSGHELTHEVLAIGAGLPGRRKGHIQGHRPPSWPRVAASANGWCIFSCVRSDPGTVRKRRESKWQQAERALNVQRSMPAR